MEPERHIEKLLQAVVKKRREQAGEPLELHPAARQELLREAAQRAAKKSGGGFFAQIFSAFGPRLALALSVVAIVAAGVWLMGPLFRGKSQVSTIGALSLRDDYAVSKSKSVPATAPPGTAAPTVAMTEPASDVNVDTTTTAAGARRSSVQAAAKDEAKKPPVPTPAFKSAPSNETGAHRKTTLGVNSAKPIGADQPGVALDDLSKSTVTVAAAPLSPPPSPPAVTHEKTRAGESFAASNVADKKSSSTAPIFATNGIAPSMTVAAADRESQKQLKQGILQPGSMNSGQAANFDSANNIQAAGNLTSNSQRFNRVITVPTVRQRGFGGGSPATAVLASFRMEQNGQEIRVIDADGSVYTGSWQAAPVQNAPAPAPTHDGGLHLWGSIPAAKSAPAAAMPDNNFQAMLNYSFTVSGTNRNLKQNITFSGNFIPLTNALNAANTGAISGLVEGRAAAPAPELLNSRIAGKVVVGENREIEVNANPAP
ncbi:MAG TPA: hypothetical protein VKV04_11730 [Verrucomicrobiae bacterium]|nr:hypothetical protein [Verrucomicrobiae bacterium]